jgi:hypothetical protein
MTGEILDSGWRCLPGDILAKLKFWSKPHVEMLRDFLRVLITPENKLSEETVCEFIKESDIEPKVVPKPRPLREFLGERARSSYDQSSFSTLLCWGVGYVVDSDLDQVRSHPAFGKARALEQRWREENKNEAPSQSNILTAIKLVCSLLFISDEDFKQLQKRLFSKKHFRADKQRFERHFLCYRYHSVSGEIVKSFLALIGPSDDVPGIARFAGFFKGTTGGERRANGIVLPMRNMTYLVGEVDGGAGLKVVAMRDLSAVRTRYEGMILSLDDDLSAVAARIVLVPTDIKSSKEVDIGIKKERKLGDEVKSLRPFLKNFIDFSLNDDVFWEGHKTDQQEMVVEVGKALRDAKGKPRLTDSSGSEFNPAATKNYTFNAALRMWTSGGEKP